MCTDQLGSSAATGASRWWPHWPSCLHTLAGRDLGSPLTPGGNENISNKVLPSRPHLLGHTSLIHTIDTLELIT